MYFRYRMYNYQGQVQIRICRLYSEDDINRDPIGTYNVLRDRLRDWRGLAPFPEFKPIVDYLIREMDTEEMKAYCRIREDLRYQYELARQSLYHVRLEFWVDCDGYPYHPPYPCPYPYKATLEAILKALEFFDLIERQTNPNLKGTPLYHRDRYFYHGWSLLEDHRVVFWPTLKELSMRDLVIARCVPLGYLGVITKTIYADRHWQSPLDFFVHDLNHTRRMVAYTFRLMERLGIVEGTWTKNQYSEMKIYEQWWEFIQRVLASCEEEDGDSADIVALKRMTMMLFFEILHESAVNPDADSIEKELKHAPGDPAPFEHNIHQDDFDKTKIEQQLRTQTGNLRSGARVADAYDPAGIIVVRYFFDKGPSVLANLWNKSRFGFYDNPDEPNEEMCPVVYRTPEHIAKAAQELFKLINREPLPYETMVKWGHDHAGIERKFTAYKQIKEEKKGDDKEKDLEVEMT